MRISKLSFWLLVLASLCASPKIPLGTSISVPETGFSGILLLKRTDNLPSLARMVTLAEAPAFSAAAVVGNAPIDLAFSRDQHSLYTTSQSMPPRFGWPITCRPDDPRSSLIGQVPVGPAPVGIAVIEAGRKLIVTSSNRFATSEHDQQPRRRQDALAHELRDAPRSAL